MFDLRHAICSSKNSPDRARKFAVPLFRIVDGARYVYDRRIPRWDGAGVVHLGKAVLPVFVDLGHEGLCHSYRPSPDLFRTCASKARKEASFCLENCAPWETVQLLARMAPPVLARNTSCLMLLICQLWDTCPLDNGRLVV